MSRSASSPSEIRLFVRFYHSLKGWCYLPAGVLLALTALLVGIYRPGWLTPVWYPLGLTLGAALLTAPWSYYMHQRYRQAYGRVQTVVENASRVPIGWSFPSLSLWAGYMVGMISWLAVLTFYLPHTLNHPDNYIVFFFVALPLSNGALLATDWSQRLVYGGLTLVLVGVTLLPVLGWPVPLTQSICYTTLGVVVATAGLYNHRILVDAFGPMSTGPSPES
jgi:hypothetical protein